MAELTPKDRQELAEFMTEECDKLSSKHIFLGMPLAQLATACSITFLNPRNSAPLILERGMVPLEQRILGAQKLLQQSDHSVDFHDEFAGMMNEIKSRLQKIIDSPSDPVPTDATSVEARVEKTDPSADCREKPIRHQIAFLPAPVEQVEYRQNTLNTYITRKLGKASNRSHHFFVIAVNDFTNFLVQLIDKVGFSDVHAPYLRQRLNEYLSSQPKFDQMAIYDHYLEFANAVVLSAGILRRGRTLQKNNIQNFLRDRARPIYEKILVSLFGGTEEEYRPELQRLHEAWITTLDYTASIKDCKKVGFVGTGNGCITQVKSLYDTLCGVDPIYEVARYNQPILPPHTPFANIVASLRISTPDLEKLCPAPPVDPESIVEPVLQADEVPRLPAEAVRVESLSTDIVDQLGWADEAVDEKGIVKLLIHELKETCCSTVWMLNRSTSLPANMIGLHQVNIRLIMRPAYEKADIHLQQIFIDAGVTSEKEKKYLLKGFISFL